MTILKSFSKVVRTLGLHETITKVKLYEVLEMTNGFRDGEGAFWCEGVIVQVDLSKVRVPGEGLRQSLNTFMVNAILGYLEHF